MDTPAHMLLCLECYMRVLSRCCRYPPLRVFVFHESGRSPPGSTRPNKAGAHWPRKLPPQTLVRGFVVWFLWQHWPAKSSIKPARMQALYSKDMLEAAIGCGSAHRCSVSESHYPANGVPVVLCFVATCGLYYMCVCCHVGLLDAALSHADCSLVLTTYEQLRLQRDLLLPVRWGVAVLDEGHKIRNPDAEVRARAWHCERRGSPAWTNVSVDIHSLISMTGHHYSIRIGSSGGYVSHLLKSCTILVWGKALMCRRMNGRAD